MTRSSILAHQHVRAYVACQDENDYRDWEEIRDAALEDPRIRSVDIEREIQRSRMEQAV